MLGTIKFVDKSVNDNSPRRLDHCDLVIASRGGFGVPTGVPNSVAVNYRYRRYKSIWIFRSIIDMDFSISIYRVSNLTSAIMG